MKRLLALALSAALILALLMTCALPAFAAATDPDLDITEPVELRFLMLGNNEQPDKDKVWGEINKLAKEDINATVVVDVLSMADHATRYPLILASGEAYDIIYTSSWAHYFTEAPKGAF